MTMKTKIVYCIVSNDKDIYLEQAWVSIYTLRKHNPDADVILLVDKGTESTLTGKRGGIRELVTEVMAIDTPDGYNAMQRSRYLKTNFRQFIAGDLLFIDADTVIGGSLAGIDNIDYEIACVPDEHRSFSQLITHDYVCHRICTAFGKMDFDDDYYFNSGVIYVKDTPRMHAFFADWYETWKHSAFERGLSLDQPALFMTNKKNGYLIKELAGEYNCQVAYSLKYFYGGLIIHFFNVSLPMLSSELSVFYDDNFYRKLKEYGGVAHEVKEVLDDKSRWFNLQTHIVDSSHFVFLSSYAGNNIFNSYREKTILYKMYERLCTYGYLIKTYSKQLKNKLFGKK